jgi:methionyl-tRNA formyltransferase
VSHVTRTLFFGSGSFALPALDCLATAPGIAVVGVVTAPPRPSGRHGGLRPTPAAERAATLGLAVLTPPRLRDEAALEELRAADAELIVLADYGRIVPPAVLALPAHGALNLHPSLLPRHRGAAPVPATILSGDRETGVTLMLMDEGLDTGPIVAQSRRPLDGSELAPDLEADLARSGAELLCRTLRAWLAGRLEAMPQPALGATLTRPLRREDGRLDPHRPAVELERQVRAYQPWPGSFIETDDGRLIVWRATLPGSTTEQTGPGASAVGGDVAPRAPDVGRLVAHDGCPALVTVDGRLRLDEVQPAGGRRMGGAEYLRGRRRQDAGRG